MLRRASHLFNGVNRRLLATSTSGMRILATDGVDECCVNIFRERGFAVDVIKTLPEEELKGIIGQYDGLVVRSATKVTASLLTAATRLKVVGRAGVGVDNISLPDATRAGVVVMNTPGGNTVSTAQLALSLLCNMARGLPQADMKVKQGLWDRKQVGVELSGKTLGVIGCGRIGQVVAHTASAMGMTVLGYDPVMTPSAFRAAFPTAVAPVAGVGHIERSDLDHLFTHSDFITVHTPLTPETAGLLNDAAFAKCRKGVRVVNCARGGIVDEAALLRALESGQVAGAALDVYTSEPPKAHLSPLLAHPNLICTPHLGASTDEAQVNVARDIAVSMSDFLTSGSTEGVVNADYLSGAHTPHLRPFVSLAHSLGSMLAQLSPSPVCQVNLRTYSKDVNLVPKRRLLAASILQGILERQCPDSTQKPSLISAPLMAKDAGIVSTISEEEPAHVGSPYWNLVQVDVQRADGSSSSITGAVFGTVPHIVKVDYSDLFAFKPDSPTLLTFRNQDKPGVISSVLEVLQAAKVNIASMNVARPVRGSGPALCVMALDDDVPASALRQLEGMQTLSQVAKISL